MGSDGNFIEKTTVNNSFVRTGGGSMGWLGLLGLGLFVARRKVA